MNQHFSIKLEKLVLTFRKSVETIPFGDVTYFYGQMGAGKSSIAKLVDYCFGGDLQLSTALQSEFVTAELYLLINSVGVAIERTRDSEQVRCSWADDDGEYDVILPARSANGILIPETEVENLSDFIFFIAGLIPPRVRKSKIKENSTLERLSFRDLLWYCYLDQDSFDSDFFNLGEDANPFKKLKSRDVLRFILGFHQEEVASLESRLQKLHLEKMQLSETAKSLHEVLKEINIDGEKEILDKIEELKTIKNSLDRELTDLRSQKLLVPHVTEQLKEQARNIAYEIEALEVAIPEIAKIIDQDSRHKNEIVMLGLKVHRVIEAKAVLAGVQFSNCPRCAQLLPERELNICKVCGQEEHLISHSNLSSEIITQDSKSRISELEESIRLHTRQLKNIENRIAELKVAKQQIDSEITSQMEDYDSAYLSTALGLERKKVRTSQEISNLEKMLVLPRKEQQVLSKLDATQLEETKIRRELEEARKGAEADLTNLTRLEELFLDCLLQAGLPGITLDHNVRISQKDFLPEVFTPDTGDIAVTSFANLSSGGKKTFFKACFGLAIHRLAAENGALLPNFLIIDSPMKNISERENKEQFEGFHDLLYRLADGELNGTQLIIVDKEFCGPQEELELEMITRHMMPDSEEHPPLIPYYRGM